MEFKLIDSDNFTSNAINSSYYSFRSTFYFPIHFLFYYYFEMMYEDAVCNIYAKNFSSFIIIIISETVKTYYSFFNNL